MNRSLPRCFWTKTRKRGSEEPNLRRGWVSQPVGRGDLAPTINGAHISSYALRPICLNQDSLDGRICRIKDFVGGASPVPRTPMNRSLPRCFWTKTRKRGSEEPNLRRGWVSQPVGRGDLAPTINGAHISSYALRPICLNQDSLDGRIYWIRGGGQNACSPGGATCL